MYCSVYLNRMHTPFPSTVFRSEFTVAILLRFRDLIAGPTLYEPIRTIRTMAYTGFAPGSKGRKGGGKNPGLRQKAVPSTLPSRIEELQPNIKVRMIITDDWRIFGEYAPLPGKTMPQIVLPGMDLYRYFQENPARSITKLANDDMSTPSTMLVNFLRHRYGEAFNEIFELLREASLAPEGVHENLILGPPQCVYRDSYGWILRITVEVMDRFFANLCISERDQKLDRKSVV